jgi:hypothetical protein
MDREVEQKFKNLEDRINQKSSEHKHCVDCGTSLMYDPHKYGFYSPYFPYEGRLVNFKPHCENCAKLHDPPPPRADHTHEETIVQGNVVLNSPKKSHSGPLPKV